MLALKNIEPSPTYKPAITKRLIYLNNSLTKYYFNSF